MVDDAPGQGLADALEGRGGEVADEPARVGGRQGFQAREGELPSVGRVGLPTPGQPDALALVGRGGSSDGRHTLRAEHAGIAGVVVTSFRRDS